MRKRNVIITAGLIMAFGAGTALVSFGGANQIIRVEDGTRQVAAAESGQAAENTEAAEDTAAAGNTAAEESLQPQLQPMRMWGTITETGEDQFSFNSQTTNGYQGDVVIHIDPEQTLILDCVAVTVYAGPVMTMSLPPQMTASVVFVNIPADGSIPLYATVASDLEDNGQGGYTLTTVDGHTITVPADCSITPYLTRQMVTLQDLTQGRKCLIWLDADGAAERIILFNS